MVENRIRLWVIESLKNVTAGKLAHQGVSTVYPGTMEDAFEQAEVLAALGYYRPKVRLARPEDIFALGTH